jgi:hypothetical protein
MIRLQTINPENGEPNVIDNHVTINQSQITSVENIHMNKPQAASSYFRGKFYKVGLSDGSYYFVMKDPT